MILTVMLLVLAFWGVFRGSLFFNRQLKAQPTDLNLIRLWNLQDYDSILTLTETNLINNPMDPYSLIFSGFASYHKAISQISADEVNLYLNKAVLDLRKALILKDLPQVELVYYILGKSYLYKGKYYADLSIKYLYKAIEAGYENLDSYEFLGEAYSYLGEYDKSIESYEIALKKFQSDRLYLKIAEDSFKFREYEKAAEYYKILIDHTTDESLQKEGLFQLGKLYYDIKNLKSAEETFTTLTDLDPTVAEAFFLLGEINYLNQDNQSARAYWHQTLRIDPEHRGARLRLYN
ncbi:tetratricopeptide repeat protein [Oceanispirochaeta crateris]|uniref:Tetratricopeptide repeat protein n=1 Tax=Oceanispirochaeta crateris TaxID=2518645 RepID=A0A5C1QJA8_9SPIO|nr:tetratricopeptide repeat protein [Oceanispirochaeta crateris]QEN07557.1 tetratricopeptide repeat protein [Oceanispirochaeta crateris]